VTFCVVLRSVPGLFYVRYLERKNVPRFHVSLARPRIRASCSHHCHNAKRKDVEHAERVEQPMFPKPNDVLPLQKCRTNMEQEDCFKTGSILWTNFAAGWQSRVI
jgi:hypothetical protein